MISFTYIILVWYHTYISYEYGIIDIYHMSMVSYYYFYCCTSSAAGGQADGFVGSSGNQMKLLL